MQKWIGEAALSKVMGWGVSNQLNPRCGRMCETYSCEFYARKEFQMRPGSCCRGRRSPELYSYTARDADTPMRHETKSVGTLWELGGILHVVRVGRLGG